MRTLPIFMDLEQQACLVVGGGRVALRKIRLLHSAGALVTVIAPKLCEELASELGRTLSWLDREFEKTDISGYRLIIAATNDFALNSDISSLAKTLNIPVNVVDQPDLCSFQMPSIIDRSPIVIAISTGGAAPSLAANLRGKFESLIPAGLGQLATAMASQRDLVKRRISDQSQRRRFWHKVVNGPVAELFSSGRAQQGLQLLNKLLDEPDLHQTIGSVSLVGAGPGNADLLTFRALHLMQNADIVLYDRLVSGAIIELCRRDAERIYVGKKRAKHSVSQTEINQLLVDLARQGKNVVRLKGGDPFIFGRGGEEIELLTKANIPFQIVPGITAASGCASYAGIPLTHRDHAQSCVFVTGHLKNGSVDLNWQQLTAANQTVVIYMGLVGLPTICEKLVEHGLPSNTPIALIEQGTTRKQRVVVGDLSNMVKRVEQAGVRAPTLTIVGSVVNLHQQLAWFESDAPG